MQNIIKNIDKYINKNVYKTAKFYVAISALVILFVSACIYTWGTTAAEILNVKTIMVFVLSIISIVVYLIVAFIKPLEFYSGLISWVMIIITFVIYVYAVYAYFPAIFFNGISPEAFKAMDKGVLSSLILIIVALIVGNVAIYLPCYKSKQVFNIEENTKEVK